MGRAAAAPVMVKVIEFTLLCVPDFPLFGLFWIIQGRFLSFLSQGSLLMKPPKGMLKDFNKILTEVGVFFGGVGVFCFKLGSVTGLFKISTDLSLGFSLLQFPACKAD